MQHTAASPTAPSTGRDDVTIIATPRSSGRTTIWDFQIPGRLLLALGYVVRLDDDALRGVQRAFRKAHARKMANAMIDGTPFVENVVVNIVGDCIHEGDTIVLSPGSTRLELIDGQHRHGGLQILQEMGREDVIDRYVFECSAVIGADDQTRRELFLAQTGRRAVSAAHTLELRAATDKFDSSRDREAYEVLRALHENSESPLSGRIVFSEGVDDRGHSKVGPGNFRSTAFHNYLKPLVGASGKRPHPLRGKSLEERTEILLRLLRAAKTVYGQFLNPEHVLGQALGINALIAIISTHGSFHVRLREVAPADPYSEEAMMLVLTTAKRFQWKPRNDIKRKALANPYSVADRLNLFLERVATDDEGIDA